MIDRRFLSMLVDSIAPGGSVAKDVTLPPASAVGCDAMLGKALDGNANLRAFVEAIVMRAGGVGSFSGNSANERNLFLETVQTEQPPDFAALVNLTLAHYYAHPRVLAALDWPSRPPQPEGHELAPFDDSLLAPVLARGAIWRQC